MNKTTRCFIYLQLIELNFERSPEYADLFTSNNPASILRNIEPMSYLEFVRASGNDRLCELLESFNIRAHINPKIHSKCLDYYFEYILIGGMPEAVSRWYETKDLGACVKVQQDLIATIRDDFNKYRGRVDTELLAAVLLSAPEQLGGKYISEQHAGQQIRIFQSYHEDPALFYWQRTGGRQGEIDYIIQHGVDVVPVEIKAGAKGAMKSLHQFMFDKSLNMAVRCDTNPPSIGQMQVKTTLGDEVSYTFLSVPLYMVELLPRLLDGVNKIGYRIISPFQSR